MKTEKILSGIAGEYFVAGELSRRGWIAGLTLRNTADIDIVATTAEGSHSVNIQVKTRRIDKAQGWDMGSNQLETKKEWNNIFYVFVALSSQPQDKELEYYIIPKNTLNKKLESVFQDWKSRKTKAGKDKKSERRIFRLTEIPEFNSLKDNWETLFAIHQ